MGRAEQLRAELAVAELEADLVALKADPNADDALLRQRKDQLRKARRVFRELRAGRPAEVAEGDATVRQTTIEAKAGVESPGGDR